MLKDDLNIDFRKSKMDKNSYLSDFTDTFLSTNVVNYKTCFKTLNGTFLYIMLTNKLKSFRITSTIETGFSDCQKMIVTFLRASFKIINILTKIKSI